MNAPPTIPGWTLERRLGAGANGEVWLAHPAAGGDPAALKLVPVANLGDPARHLRDTWAAGSTGSRHVVSVIDAGIHQQTLWLAMELAAGDAATRARERGGRLPWREVLPIIRDAAKGLQALAEHGLVHRDITPGNILLRSDGSAMLGDLGTVRGGEAAARSANLPGTPAFLAPEQVRGLGSDVRSDIYSLAATAYALIAGEPPFRSGNPLELLRLIAEAEAPALPETEPECPAALSVLLCAAMAKDPAARPQRPAAFAQALDDILAGRTPGTASHGATTPVAATRAASVRTVPRHWLLPGATVLGLALGTLLGYICSGSHPDPVADATAADDGSGRWLARERQRADETARLERSLRDRIASLEAKQRDPVADREPGSTATTPPVASSAAQAVAIDPARPLPADAAACDPPPTPNRISVTQLPYSPAGIAWSRTRPGHLLLWNVDHASTSNDGGLTWHTVWSDPEAEARGGFTGPDSVACWAGRSVFLGAGRKGLGLLSQDGGASFTQLPRPEHADLIRNEASFECGQRTLLGNGSLAVVCRLPKDGNTFGLFISKDAGRTWSRSTTLPCGITGIETGPDQPVLWINGNGSSCPWQVSLDGGTTWTKIGNNRYDARRAAWTFAGTQNAFLDKDLLVEIDFASHSVTGRSINAKPLSDPVAVVRDPRDARRIYVADSQLGLLRSVDDGRTWQTFVRTIPSGLCALDLTGVQRPRLAALTDQEQLLVIDLTQPDDDLFRSPPVLAPGALVRVAPKGVKTGSLAFACRPGTSEMLVWNRSGVWRTKDGGATWVTMDSSGIPEFDPRLIRTTPSWNSTGDSLILPFALHQGPQALIATPGRTLRLLPSPWGGIKAHYSLAPFMLADGTVAAGWSPEQAPSQTAPKTPIHVVSSRDGGLSWREERQIDDNDYKVLNLEGTPVLMGGRIGDLIASTDLGRTLFPIRIPDSMPGAVTFAASNLVWTTDSGGSRLASFDYSTKQWLVKPLVLPTGRYPINYTVSGFVVDPRDYRRIWISHQDGLIHSSDGGTTWRQSSMDLRLMESGRLGWLSGKQPRLVAIGTDGLILIDGGEAGEALFDRYCNLSP